MRLPEGVGTAGVVRTGRRLAAVVAVDLLAEAVEVLAWMVQVVAVDLGSSTRPWCTTPS
jgi:hypothetical protein